MVKVLKFFFRARSVHSLWVPDAIPWAWQDGVGDQSWAHEGLGWAGAGTLPSAKLA